MILHQSDVAPNELGGGVTRKILATGGTMMTVQFTFEKDAVGAPHSHPHEQVGYVVKGRFTITLGDQVDTIEEGDSYYVPSNIQHGVVALEDGILLDVFTPQREDFLKG